MGFLSYIFEIPVFLVYFHQKCKLKEDPLTFGALCILKHLLPRCILLSFISITYHSELIYHPNLMMLHCVRRLFEAWHSKRPLLVDTASSLLDEQSLAVRKALSEVLSWRRFSYLLLKYACFSIVLLL